jgi:hypothetical protein
MMTGMAHAVCAITGSGGALAVVSKPCRFSSHPDSSATHAATANAGMAISEMVAGTETPMSGRTRLITTTGTTSEPPNSSKALSHPNHNPLQTRKTQLLSLPISGMEQTATASGVFPRHSRRSICDRSCN